MFDMMRCFEKVLRAQKARDFALTESQPHSYKMDLKMKAKSVKAQEACHCVTILFSPGVWAI